MCVLKLCVEPASWSFLDTALKMCKSVISVEITEGTSQLNSEAVF